MVFIVVVVMFGIVVFVEMDFDMKFVGVLEFLEDGMLFVGDNYNGVIYVFEILGEVGE